MSDDEGASGGAARKRSRRDGARLAECLASRAADVVLLVVAAWLLLGPRGPLRRDLEAWREGRTVRARLARAWPELTAEGGILGTAAPGGRTLVVFDDYRCPFCARGQTRLDALLREGHALRVVIRHLPARRLHPDAALLARVAVCAENDPAFPAVHRALFDAPRPALGSPEYLEVRSDAGLLHLLRRAGVDDPAAVLRCAASPAARRRLDADAGWAGELGLRGTPTYVTRSGVHTGALSTDALRELLDLPHPR